MARDTGEVDQLNVQIDARMDTLQAAITKCAAMSSADEAAWGSFYLAWKSLSIYWKDLRASGGIVSGIQSLFDAEGLVGTSIYDQMASFQSLIDPNNPNGWPARVNKACPGSYAAPPAIAAATPTPSTNWVQLIQYGITGAIAVSVAVVLFKGLSIAEDLTGHTHARGER
jgi:hypothetical protein